MTADPLLISTTERMLAEYSTADVRRRAERDGWQAALWGKVSAAGLQLIGVPPERGGVGGSLADAVGVLRLAGRHAAPIPLAENGFLAGWLLAEAGLDCPEEVVTTPTAIEVGLSLTPAPDGGWLLDGRADPVPWGRDARWLAALARAGDGLRVVRVPLAGAAIEHGRSMANEPRDAVIFQHVSLPSDAVGPDGGPQLLDQLIRRGALARAALMTGALERVAEMTTEYAWVRKQFGRPIGAFQAVQQHLVRLNSETTAAAVAVDVVVAAEEDQPGRGEVGLAKEVANSAASLVTALAHQVHGAIGMTEEHTLQHFTRRLWVWRQEFGSSAYWRSRIGADVVAAGADELWPRVTGTHA
jgi:acyl-CoA dehydrogenase